MTYKGWYAIKQRNQTKPMWQLYYFCSLRLCIHIGGLNIHRTHVTANNSTYDNVVFFFVSDLKIVYYNNY